MIFLKKNKFKYYKSANFRTNLYLCGKLLTTVKLMLNVLNLVLMLRIGMP